MAERAAHLTSAVTESKPTIFEVIAQENLMHGIRPALHHVVKVLAESRPESLGWTLHWFDEIYTVLDFVLQNYYLHYHNGSFAENFYSLKRVCSCNRDQKRLPRKEHWKSLFCLNKSWHSLLKLFVMVYPYIHMSWEGSLLAFQVMYMFGKSRWHSPLIKASGVELRQHDMDDMVTEEKTDSIDWSHASLKEKLNFSSFRVLNFTAQTLSTGLSVGVFFLQFLDWWYASDTNAPSLMALPIPDPPQVNSDVAVPKSELCPLCLKIRTNDTALSVSGYVFCYPCIHEYIKQHRCCPVTSYPASTSSLVKLYPPDS
ncbi:hypothetical protein FSP39_004225 [Pinctada imbricata]|uniref:Peroxisome assembly protein 12 n=1 Tax=Pinctada imbricata TaxID=66713 RepID=A0AA89BJY7_PINIB|nr:hypothetical protein FSP39_004225 [Pinctada imbricata]